MSETRVESARRVPIETITQARLIPLKRTGSELIGACPLCGGTDRFAVNLKKQIFNCRGCGGKGDVIDLIQFLDGADFPSALDTLIGPAPPRKKPNGNGETHDEGASVFAGEWNYEDENGNLLFQVQRLNRYRADGSPLLKDGKQKKYFPQRHPNPNKPGKWISDIDGVRRVLYRLPELLEDLAHNREIILAEGELKVDLLRGWGFASTCNPMGAKKWLDEYSAFLRGASVVIMPDNDELGRKHIDKVAASLVRVGATVRVLDLPGLAPKGDVIDWAAGGGTVEQLHELIAAALPYEALSEPFIDERLSGELSVRQLPPKFPRIPWNEISFEAIGEWLVKKLLPRKGVAAFYGASGSAKTFVLFDIFLHIALGWNWGGRRVAQAPVVYISAEGAGGLRKRKIGWQLAHAASPGGVPLPSEIPFDLIEVAPNLGVGQDDLKALIASIEATGAKPGAIAIDTVAQTLGSGDENNTGMVQFVANATALANQFGCLVALVHHVPLGDDKRLRGHTSLLGALDASTLCERQEGSLSATLTIKKLKDEEDGQKFTVHLARVILGKDEDGEDVSTLFVESVAAGAVDGDKAPRQKSIPASLRLFASSLSFALDEAGEMIQPFPNGPLLKAAPDSAVRRRYYAAIAEQAEQGDDPKAIAARQRVAWNRTIKTALEQTIVLAVSHGGKRFIWFK